MGHLDWSLVETGTFETRSVIYTRKASIQDSSQQHYHHWGLLEPHNLVQKSKSVKLGVWLK